MSNYEQKPGDLIIFKNDKKEEDKHPDYKGWGIQLDGQAVDVALWIKEGAKGKFFSGRISQKIERAESKMPKPQKAEENYSSDKFANSEDDLPW